MTLKKTVHVAVGVIERQSSNGEREILISKRHQDVHQGGLWEFPGGKVEEGESLPIALARELEEELGLVLNPANEKALRPLIQIFHDYGDKAVLLDVWLVSEFSNAPEDGLGVERQQVKWVEVGQLNQFSFPQANVPIIAACQLPQHYAITPVYSCIENAKREVGDLIEKTKGLILFRQPQLSQAEYFSWLDDLLVTFSDLRERLMLSLSLTDEVKDSNHLFEGYEAYLSRVRGFHLPFRLAENLDKCGPDSSLLLAVSCHSLEELRKAEALGADFATLSPVQNTASHPNAEPIGWYQFEDWVRQVALPVYALGGMSTKCLSRSFDAGAQGIAGISAWGQK